MNIGELFVNLGIKGGDKTQNTLKGVKKDMKDVKSFSLEAKAAILATFFGLQRLMSQSMQNGTALTQFSNLTGLSTKKLQQWQYASKMAGGTAEEVTGIVTGMQSAFAQLQLGEGPAKYLGLFAEGLERVGESLDPQKMSDVFYTLEKARAFLKGGGTGNIGRDNEIIASLGISQSMIAGLRGGMFDDKILNKASVYTDSQAKELQRLQSMWTGLADTIQKEIGKLNTQFGGQLIKDIGNVTVQLMGLVKQLLILSEKVGVFERISKATENIANLINLTTGVVNDFTGPMSQDDKDFNKMAQADRQRRWDAARKQRGGKDLTFLDVVADAFKSKYGFLFSEPGANVSNLSAGSRHAIAPSTAGFGSTQPNVTIQQELNFGNNASNPEAVRQGARQGSNKGVQEAWNNILQGQ